jgi:hypothetical protein
MKLDEIIERNDMIEQSVYVYVLWNIFRYNVKEEMWVIGLRENKLRIYEAVLW